MDNLLQSNTYLGLVEAVVQGTEAVDRCALMDWLEDHGLLTQERVTRLVLDHPDADGPRLLYADWVRPQDFLRATLIEKQMGRYGSKSAKELRRRYGYCWLQGRNCGASTPDVREPEAFRSTTWRRGFVEEVRASWGWIREMLPTAVLHHPVRVVEVLGERPAQWTHGWSPFSANLPSWLLDWMTANTCDTSGRLLKQYPSMSVVHPTKRAAKDAFSQLLLAWAKHPKGGQAR